nr:MAG TPA: hypothetical protein [Herelleviridae sp.]
MTKQFKLLYRGIVRRIFEIWGWDIPAFLHNSLRVFSNALHEYELLLYQQEWLSSKLSHSISIIN